MVLCDSALGQVRDNQNILVTTGQWGGDTIFAGRGAGGGPTAVAVVSDLLGIARHAPVSAPAANPGEEVEVRPDFVAPHYLRFGVAASDARGLEAKLQEAEVEVDEWLSRPRGRTGTVALLMKPSTTAQAESVLRRLQAKCGACLPALVPSGK